MTKIAVVFHSGYGHTLRMAQAIAEGNLPAGGWETLNAADAIIMGSRPTWAP